MGEPLAVMFWTSKALGKPFLGMDFLPSSFSVHLDKQILNIILELRTPRLQSNNIHSKYFPNVMLLPGRFFSFFIIFIYVSLPLVTMKKLWDWHSHHHYPHCNLAREIIQKQPSDGGAMLAREVGYIFGEGCPCFGFSLHHVWLYTIDFLAVPATWIH